MTPRKDTTRRTAIRQLAGTAAAAAFPIYGQNPAPESHHATQPVTHAAEYKYKFFQPQQLATLNALGETIIPADEHSPGAKAAHVAEYIDATAAEASAGTKTLWTEGLAHIEQRAEEKFAKSFAACSAEQQVTILTAFAQNENSPRTPDEQFFRVLKRATIDGYYTSAIGIHQDLQYQGNQAMSSFAGCQHNEKGDDHS